MKVRERGGAGAVVAEREAAGAVGLSKAAELAGVSVSTLRRWADEGRVSSFRTAGGHRRFRVADVQAVAGSQVVAVEADALGDLAVSRIRRQLAAPRTRDMEWMHGLDGEARARLGLLGRHLLSTMEDYLTRRRTRAAALAEARQFGLMYGRELSQGKFTIRQAMEAFTFFRRSLEEATRRYAAGQHIDATTLDDLRDQLDVINDRVLLGIAEAYDQRPAEG